MNNLFSSQNHRGSKPIVIYGELSSSEDDDTSSQKRTPSTAKNRRRKALSLEVSPLAYFNELEAVMLKENGIGQLNDQLPLVIRISRDRANDEKPKKHLRRRRHGRKITSGTGNTTILYIVQIPATTQIRPTHLQAERTSQDSGGDQAAEEVVKNTTSVRVRDELPGASECLHHKRLRHLSFGSQPKQKHEQPYADDLLHSCYLWLSRCVFWSLTSFDSAITFSELPCTTSSYVAKQTRKLYILALECTYHLTYYKSAKNAARSSRS